MKQVYCVHMSSSASERFLCGAGNTMIDQRYSLVLKLSKCIANGGIQIRE